MNPTPGPAAYLHTDFETTGLDIEGDFLLEMAVILTDAELVEIDRYQTLIRPADGMWDRLASNEYVSTMHHDSGLADELTATNLPPLLDVDLYLERWLAERRTDAPVRIAGGGVANFDWPWMKRWMPHLASGLHYRPMDFSILTQAISDATGTSTLRKQGVKAHRAMADVAEDLAVARTIWGLLREIPGLHELG